MGNNNSGSFNTVHSPPPWTQSLPRDTHKLKKYGALQQGTKVLPERIPGQRLRPTENGRILHHQGTISHRKLMESISAPNGVNVPKISHQHSTSMSALNLSPSMAPRTIISEPRRGDVILPQRKTFKSEPDLREMSPFEIRHSQPANPLHTIIHESPIKGRIMSKKRYKAPPPPENYNPELPIQLVRMDKPSPKLKSRKARIFKKNSTAKVAKNDGDENLMIRNVLDDERKSRNAKKGSHEFDEAKDRTRSMDNLHYNIQKTKEHISYPMQIVSINTPERNLYSEYHDNNNKKIINGIDFPPRPSKKEKDINSYVDVHRANDVLDITSRLKGDKYVDDRFLPPSNKDDYKQAVNGHNKITDLAESRAKIEYQTIKNKTNKIPDISEDPWDKAEREWTEKKRNSEMLQKEITNAAKNLKKVSSISRKALTEERCPSSKSNEVQIASNIQEPNFNKTEPKTFFFGMDTKPNSEMAVKSIETGIQIQPVTITKTAINDKLTKSLDRRKKNISNKLGFEEESNVEKKPIANKIDEFVANIERNKLNLKPSQAELFQSISHEDGGYHSRQSSETWQTENDKDDGEKIKMNLRPTLPKRQLELPRFSPNAAWRSLGIETSSRGREGLSDTLENSGSVPIQEEQTNRRKHIPSSGGSGEKSGDSGISGDGGSPGLVGDFDPMILKKRDVYNGPIAISSPISSTKLENKRAWTPAQDLDDNSFEDNADPSSKLVPHDIPAFPKLTSRTNMFADVMENEVTVNGHDESDSRVTSVENTNNDVSTFNGSDMPHIEEDFTKHDTSTSCKINNELHQNDGNITLNEDTWRENWSLSRSIPNSINKCGDNDCNSNSSYVHGTRSESRMSNCDGKLAMRPITPSYMHHGNAGHIMYLPQYKTYNLKYKPHIRDCHSVNGNEVTRQYIPESCISPTVIDDNRRNPRDIPMDKKKKFAYKSTIRMLEKRWLEEKLNKDAQEKEDRRLKEMDEIMKVEKEFRNKREKEKIKLKKQLHLMNFQQPNNGSSNEDGTNSSVKTENYYNEKISPSSSYQRNGHQSSSPEYNRNAREHIEDTASFISGVKKWVKGRKKHSNGGGYASDASSTTITSTSRQEPDGAPATANRKGSDNFREVIMAGARSRNGSLIIGESPHSSEIDSEARYRPRGDFSSDIQSNASVCTSLSSDQKRNYARHSNANKQSEMSGKRNTHKYSKSPAASESSRTSSRRPYSPNLKGTLSPDSKRSLASEPLTRELYEDSKDTRKYKEYRISSKRPTSQQSIKYYKNVRDNELIDNYRRNFAQGQMLNYPQRSYHEEFDIHTRQSIDGRSAKKSGASSRRNYATDGLESAPQRKSPLRQSLSYNYRVPPIDNSPGRFAGNHMTPFNQSEEFRPVVFNSNSINKVLSVT